MPVHLDDSAWPVVTLQISGSLSESEEETFISTSVGFPERRQRYVAIIHLLEAATPTTRFVRGQACAQREYRQSLETYCAGVAFVIGSAMIRGALRAILHIQSLPSPYVVVGTVEDAQAWAERQISNASPESS